MTRRELSEVYTPIPYGGMGTFMSAVSWAQWSSVEVQSLSICFEILYFEAKPTEH